MSAPGTERSGRRPARSPRWRAVRSAIVSLVSIALGSQSGASLAAGPFDPASAERAARLGDQRLGPLVLASPIAAATIERVLAEGESEYRARRIAQALESFRQVAEIDPSNALAWLRIGNLHQQLGEFAPAAAAYRMAAGTVDLDRWREVRDKALLNLALLGLDEADAALAQLESEPLPPALAAARSQVAGDLAGARARSRRALARPDNAAPRAAEPAVESAESREAPEILVGTPGEPPAKPSRKRKRGHRKAGSKVHGANQATDAEPQDR